MAFLLFLAPPMYQAVVEISDPQYATDRVALANDFELCQSTVVRDAVLREFYFKSGYEQAWDDVINIDRDETKQLIRITIVDQSSEQAAAIANSYRNYFIEAKSQLPKAMTQLYADLIRKDNNRHIGELEKLTEAGASQQEKFALIGQYAMNQRLLQSIKKAPVDQETASAQSATVTKQSAWGKQCSQVALALVRGALWGLALCLLCIATAPVFTREKSVSLDRSTGSSWLDGEAPAE